MLVAGTAMPAVGRDCKAVTKGSTPAAPIRLTHRRMAIRAAAKSRDVSVDAAAELTETPASSAPSSSSASGGDPWRDEPWASKKWTVYRGEAFDLTDYLARGTHPGGDFLLRLAIGRDSTGLFESYHLRPEVAVAHLKRLPKLEGFPIDAVPVSPRPNDSELYNSIRERVKKEVFKGEEIRGMHRSGTEAAALAILGYAAAAWSLYFWSPNVVTGSLLGLAGAWIGLTVQHCGNHGAMSTKVWLNEFYGLCADLTGGSALMWRYHHQVSHHIHCNDEALDEDVFSALPLLRFDPRYERKWFHQFQHIYMWALYPFLQIVFQINDIKSLITNRTHGATLYGATQSERATVIGGKVAHHLLLWIIPLFAHAPQDVLSGVISYTVTMGIVLSTTFAVSHNLEENKPAAEGSATTDAMLEDYASRDWALQQVLTSSNWGGNVGNFFTGGLNLQIEHHLFPAIAFVHYPAISKIVREECEKRGISYVHYDTLPEIVERFVRYMKDVGSQDMPEVFVKAHERALGPKEAALARL